MLHDPIVQSCLIVAAGFLLGSALARFFKYNFEFCLSIFIISGIIAALRIKGITDDTFKVIAHIIVGGLYGGAVRTWFLVSFRSSLKYGLLALALTLLETYCALASRKII